ncbi:MAG: hypothetical protein F6J99_24785, partial [Moorea sp. SIO4G3]|nr:hypothetical protein [Moorena sp. SIO4G3]
VFLFSSCRRQTRWRIEGEGSSGVWESEVGRWGDGEMGRWGDREMGR